jgi:hypothetical protein
VRGAAAAAVSLAASCLSPMRYACDDAEQCERDGKVGVCTDAGWCAYADDDCTSGLRYSPIAGDALADECVPVVVEPGSSSTTAGTSSSTSSSGDQSSSTTAADCESICVVGTHATAAMCDEAGTCIVTCEAPWENCDGDPSNGCEVPVGVAHQCDKEGLDPVEGCWTAYCGASEAPAAVNFGTFYCIDCITCQEPVENQCRWCEHATGYWYPMKPDCFCSPEALGAVCGP